ncbi:PTS sugar transporter subunit IIA [bacterium]|nr:PTS sugar transporter subunit IIA [bacterium]
MKIETSLIKDCVQIGFKSRDKDSVIREMASIAKRNPILDNCSVDEIYNGLIDREKLGSTGFGHGIAIPHCMLDSVESFVIGIVIDPEGIDYDSMDKEKSRIFAFIVAPKSGKNEHIHLLSVISKIFYFIENRQAFLELDNIEDIFNKYLNALKAIFAPKTEELHYHFTVMVQVEEIFMEILELFTSLDEHFASVIEAKDASYYLHSLPLFSSFWADNDALGFHRIIIAVVRKSAANEIHRRISLMIEELEDKSGIMVFTQEIFYLNGTLNF